MIQRRSFPADDASAALASSRARTLPTTATGSQRMSK